MAVRRVDAGLVGLTAAERALVEEEELEVLAPAEGPVEAVLAGVRHGRVVGERLDPGLVDRRVGPLVVVVDELVIVPVAVGRAGAAQLLQVRQREVLAVLRPLLRDGGGGPAGAGDLGVRVDRVAEVDVEVVALARHPAVDLERVVVGLARAGRALRVGVARERERDRRVRIRGRRGREAPDRAAGLPPPEAVRVRGRRPEPLDDGLDGGVGRGLRGQRPRDRDAPQPAVGRDLERDLPGLPDAGPELRRARRDLTRCHPGVEGLRAGHRRCEHQRGEGHGDDERGRAAHADSSSGADARAGCCRACAWVPARAW